ncbi:MAG TPA: NAD(P)-binding domain-containing protein [Candidatus Acidoferrum sp.]|nr:NAD(P)-binding domain-containing protein [Candidatus Acidoferrum sp.]
MDNFISFLIAAAIIGAFLYFHLRAEKKKHAAAKAAVEKSKIRSDGPQSQHPHIDSNYCIGCATCTTVCPEGDVLGMIGGKAMIINGYKCIGHSLCAEACPVGAIAMVLASPSVGASLATLTPAYETTIKNMFIIGELGGLALIKNAVNQGRDCVDTVVSRLSSAKSAGAIGIYDLLIVGAGPAGISASLRAAEKKLNYLTLEESEIGGTVAKYPRQKLVLTSPVEFPMYGKFKKTEISKEQLLEFWQNVLKRADFKCKTGEKVNNIVKAEDGNFVVTTGKGDHRARHVILALGKSGSPRKLGVKGEELPKVMYRLIEADHYINKKILVIGGGDSAVEAAMGLASQLGNIVTLSYRQETFSRIKDRNSQRINDFMGKGKVKVLFNSSPVEILNDSVILEVKGVRQTLPNDYVWIFAGGEPPTAFLKKIGIGFSNRDVTNEGARAAKDAKEQVLVTA